MNTRNERHTTGGRYLFFLFAALFACSIGCGSKEKPAETLSKSPRPVEARTLVKSAPVTASMVTASIASWKTQEIGLEVTGRVEWVAEPNTAIEGRVVSADGQVVIEGTPIARIDDEKYRLQVANAQAQVERAKQNISAADTEIKKSLPAQLRAAEAEKKLALTEFERSKRLFQQKAGAQSDVDRDEAKYQSAVSAIEQLQAVSNAKQAEFKALQLQLQQDEKSLRDAQRSLEDCTLYSSFRGQISEVSVVPGSVVNAGEPVATIQMMDPIKIELEVSSDESRRLRHRQRLPIIVTNEAGAPEVKDGFLYLIDPVADPQTRTFTVTLLAINKRANDDAKNELGYPTTEQTWRLDLPFIPGAEPGKTYVGENAILFDNDGPFLWRIENVTVSESLPKDRLLKVRKMRVDLKPARLPFLGNWVFREIEVLDNTFDPSTHMVVAELNVPEGEPGDWIGDTILFQESTQWNLRPGDLVQVDLSDTEESIGLFVPIDAISHQAGKYSIFLVDETSSPNSVEKVEIKMAELGQSASTSSMLRIEAADASIQLEGRKYVSKGAHYLREGEAVKVIDGEGSQ